MSPKRWPVRHQQAGRLSTLLGMQPGQRRADRRAGPAAHAPPSTRRSCRSSWREIEAREGKRDWTLSDQQIEWCRAHGLKICGGPLLQIDKWSLPDWMYLWGEDDRESFRSCVAEHIEAVVEPLSRQSATLAVRRRLNVNNDFGQDEEERLRLAVLTIETIRRVDPRGAGRDHDRSALGLVHEPRGLRSSRRCTLPTRWCGPTWDWPASGWKSTSAIRPRGTEPRDVAGIRPADGPLEHAGLAAVGDSHGAQRASGNDPQAALAPHPRDYAGSGRRCRPTTQRAWAEQLLARAVGQAAGAGIIWNQLLRQPAPRLRPRRPVRRCRTAPSRFLESARRRCGGSIWPDAIQRVALDRSGRGSSRGRSRPGTCRRFAGGRRRSA